MHARRSALALAMALLAAGHWTACLGAEPVTVNALSYYQSGGQVGGVCGPVEIWFDQNPGKSFRLAFIEDEIDGYGELWRAAAWQASLVAADLSGRDVAGVRLFFQRSGRVDGPSAGALTTVGVLAALRGDKVLSDVAMTGTINPDGTIGPVGGVPHKIDGAAAAGMRLVLIPYGMRNDRDETLGRDVDLFQRAADRGIELRAVGDIYEAYRLATGSELPRPAPAPVPTLGNASYQQAKIITSKWRLRFREEAAEYDRIPEDHKSEYTEAMMEWAREVEENVDDHLAQGVAPAALVAITEAASSAALANEVARTIWVDNDRGREGAIEYARLFAQAPMKRRMAIDRLKNASPRTLGALGTTIYAYMSLTEGITYENLGNLMLSGKLEKPILTRVTEEDDVELERILEAVYYMQMAAADYDYVEDVLDLASRVEGRATPASMPLEATADFFRRAAQANLNQFEKLVIDQAADGAGVTYSRAKDAMLSKDEQYLLAWGAQQFSQAEMFREFEGDQLSLARLALAIRTYTLSSSLVANHYSLGVEMDDEGYIVDVKRDAPLKYMLDFAEDQTRRNIQLLRNEDVDPSDVVFDYVSAGMLRGGDQGEQLQALQWYWEANTVARTIAYLGGFAKQAPEGGAEAGAVADDVKAAK
ncbi:Lon protease [Pirellulimonas nuda]|uniref:endopeptidase La n=1 Tax=Pirellulimonas nuda TaxID=2528009 RepID=A0A518DEB2_9BACT|nr:S16 family serine protease [Pirellulimonas nuda]QDU89825.1 Lon protease [Pirellulimonas nuda]